MLLDVPFVDMFLTYTHTHTCSSFIHQTVLMANGCETSHLTPYMTNIQSTANNTQFKNHNYIYILKPSLK